MFSMHNIVIKYDYALVMYHLSKNVLQVERFAATDSKFKKLNLEI